MSNEVVYTDCLGKPLESRRYALLEGSRVRLVELARIDGDDLRGGRVPLLRRG